jgi:tripartite ATP-independent transporter DctP family solute receptor
MKFWTKVSGIIVASTLAASVNAQDVNFKLGMVTGPDSHQNIAAEKFVQLMNERSKGEIRGKVYHSSALGSTAQLLEGMNLGTVQSTITVVFDSYVEKTAVLQVPFLFRDTEHFYKVIDGPIGDEVVADAPKKGFRVLSIWDSGMRQIWTKDKSINKLEDLRGMKIRVPSGKIWVNSFKALGVNPTPMALGEVYSGLQQGTIDGMEQPIAYTYADKFYEVLKYMVEVDYQVSPGYLIVSDRWWKSLSPEGQKVAMEAVKEAKIFQRNVKAEQDKVALKNMTDKGLKVNKPDRQSFIDAVKPVVEDYEKRFGKDVFDRIRQTH